jgi:hypothetical protein
LNTAKPRHTIAGLVQINGNANPILPPTTTMPNPIILPNKTEPFIANPSTGTAWKSSQSKPIPLNGNVTPPNGTATSPGSRDGSETEIQLASCIVPNVQPPKVLTKNRVELVSFFFFFFFFFLFFSFLFLTMTVNQKRSKQEKV